MNDGGRKYTTERFNFLPVLTLVAGHGTVDLYGSFIAPLLPLFADRFNLSLTLVGTLVSIIFMADGLSQPIFGYWGDRMRRPWMAMLAPFWVAAATGFLGLANGYAMLVFVLIMLGTGRSAFHPQGAASVTQYAGSHKALSLSLFTSVGELGFAAGPLLATTLITLWGLQGALYTMPLGLVVTALLYTVVFKDIHFRSSSWRPPPLKVVFGSLARNRENLAKLWIVVVLRSLTEFSLFSFLPIIFTRQGLSTMQTGIMISIFLFGGALGGIAGGWLSDRLGERSVIAGSLTLAFPTLQLALTLPGQWGSIFLMLGGFCLLSSSPVTIALAQRYAPGSVATVSSLMLGLGWSAGGLIVTMVGILADYLGPIAALRIEGLCLAVAVLLTLRLPPLAKPRTKI